MDDKPESKMSWYLLQVLEKALGQNGRSIDTGREWHGNVMGNVLVRDVRHGAGQEWVGKR